MLSKNLNQPSNWLAAQLLCRLEGTNRYTNNAHQQVLTFSRCWWYFNLFSSTTSSSSPCSTPSWSESPLSHGSFAWLRTAYEQHHLMIAALTQSKRYCHTTIASFGVENPLRIQYIYIYIHAQKWLSYDRPTMNSVHFADWSQTGVEGQMANHHITSMESSSLPTT